jgi:hypothetical protein
MGQPARSRCETGPTIKRANRIEDRLRLSVTIELKKCDKSNAWFYPVTAFASLLSHLLFCWPPIVWRSSDQVPGVLRVPPWTLNRQRSHFGSENGLPCELQEQIRRRAYEMYEQCGRDDGMN